MSVDVMKLLTMGVTRYHYLSNLGALYLSSTMKLFKNYSNFDIYTCQHVHVSLYLCLYTMVLENKVIKKNTTT